MDSIKEDIRYHEQEHIKSLKQSYREGKIMYHCMNCSGLTDKNRIYCDAICYQEHRHTHKSER